MTDPEGRRGGLRVAAPAFALLVPPLCVGIAAGLDEGEVFGVADQQLRSLERGDGNFALAVLVVPAVNRVVEGLAKAHAARCDGNQRVVRSISQL